MSHPRVLILYNEPVLAPDHPDYGAEADVLYSVKIVRESLLAEGIPSAEFGVTDDITALLARLQQKDFEVAFNLYEGTADRSITEVYFTGLLEWLNIAYTGCPSATLSLARNKLMAKRVFLGAGILTPAFHFLDSEDVTSNPVGTFPAIVKPASEDASIGIDQGSVVTTDAELRARVKYVRENYGGAVLVEKFIAGREIQVSLVDLEGDGKPAVLPLAEIAYKPPDGQKFWPIYTYTAKWDEASAEYAAAPVIVGVNLPADMLMCVKETAKRVYEVLGARDFARVDMRVTDDGDVFVLELNPNPSITSVMLDSGLPALEVTYNQFIAALVRNAVKRGTGAEGARRVRKLPDQTPAVQ